MECCLCKKEKKLIDAHILPWCFYKDLVPSGEKYESPVLISKGGRDERRSKGSYDKDILCADCDNRIGTVDNQAYKLLQTVPRFEREKLGFFPNSNYETFGMFIMSVIWRASISTRPEFEKLFLGPYEEMVCKKINDYLKGEKSLTFDYLVIKNEDKNLPVDIVEKSIMLPFSYKFQKVINVSEFSVPGGFRILMKFDKREFPPSIVNLIQICKEQGKVHFIVRDNFSSSNEFKSLIEMASG